MKWYGILYPWVTEDVLACANEKQEQYTRHDNLRLFISDNLRLLNFPSSEDGDLSAKFI